MKTVFYKMASGVFRRISGGAETVYRYGSGSPVSYPVSYLLRSFTVLLLFCLSVLTFTQAKASQQKTVRIEFWTMSLKPKFIPYFQQLIRDYESLHPGTQIIWTDYPWDILQLKLVTAIAAGKPPALVNLSVPWAEALARDGMLEPVDQWLAPAGQQADYTDGALEDLRFNGRLYGFPHYSNVNVIAYNKTLLQQAGVNRAPADLNQVFQMAIRIAERTGKPAYAPALGKIDGFFLQQGLPVLKGQRAAFDSDAHVRLVEQLKTVYAAGGLLKDKLFAEDNFPAVIDAYLGGRLAMMVSAPSAIRRVQTDAPDIYAQTGIFAMPAGPTGINDGGWMFHFAVPKGNQSGQMPAIAEFARYLTGSARQLEFASLAGVMPTTRSGLRQTLIRAAGNSSDPAQQAVIEAARSMQNARSLYVSGIEDYDELRRILVQATEAAVTGRKPVRSSLEEAARIWNKKLATQKGGR